MRPEVKDEPGRKFLSHEAKGKVLRSPVTGMVFVPYEMSRQGWYIVVVDSGPNPECQKSYPVGGYNLWCSGTEIEQCEVIPIPPPAAKEIDSRDEQGRYCGMRSADGEMQIPQPGKAGYCGPECPHCVDYPVYREQDGVWCCVADFDHEKVEIS